MIDHALIFTSPFSETKLRFAIAKGMAQFKVKKRLGKFSPFVEGPLARISEYMFRALR